LIGKDLPFTIRVVSVLELDTVELAPVEFCAFAGWIGSVDTNTVDKSICIDKAIISVFEVSIFDL
jgi:hypothetical protein